MMNVAAAFEVETTEHFETESYTRRHNELFNRYFLDEIKSGKYLCISELLEQQTQRLCTQHSNTPVFAEVQRLVLESQNGLFGKQIANCDEEARKTFDQQTSK